MSSISSMNSSGNLAGMTGVSSNHSANTAIRLQSLLFTTVLAAISQSQQYIPQPISANTAIASWEYYNRVRNSTEMHYLPGVLPVLHPLGIRVYRQDPNTIPSGLTESVWNQAILKFPQVPLLPEQPIRYEIKTVSNYASLFSVSSSDQSPSKRVMSLLHNTATQGGAFGPNTNANPNTNPTPNNIIPTFPVCTFGDTLYSPTEKMLRRPAAIFTQRMASSRQSYISYLKKQYEHIEASSVSGIDEGNRSRGSSGSASGPGFVPSSLTSGTSSVPSSRNQSSSITSGPSASILASNAASAGTGSFFEQCGLLGVDVEAQPEPVVGGEAVTVCVPLTNPLLIPVYILKARFVVDCLISAPCTGQSASALNGSTAATLGEEGVHYLLSSISFVLPPKSNVIVELSVTPLPAPIRPPTAFGVGIDMTSDIMNDFTISSLLIRGIAFELSDQNPILFANPNANPNYSRRRSTSLSQSHSQSQSQNTSPTNSINSTSSTSSGSSTSDIAGLALNTSVTSTIPPSSKHGTRRSSVTRGLSHPNTLTDNSSVHAHSQTQTQFPQLHYASSSSSQFYTSPQTSLFVLPTIYIPFPTIPCSQLHLSSLALNPAPTSTSRSGQLPASHAPSSSPTSSHPISTQISTNSPSPSSSSSTSPVSPSFASSSSSEGKDVDWKYGRLGTLHNQGNLPIPLDVPSSQHSTPWEDSSSFIYLPQPQWTLLPHVGLSRQLLSSAGIFELSQYRDEYWGAVKAGNNPTHVSVAVPTPLLPAYLHALTPGQLTSSLLVDMNIVSSSAPPSVLASLNSTSSISAATLYPSTPLTPTIRFPIPLCAISSTWSVAPTRPKFSALPLQMSSSVPPLSPVLGFSAGSATIDPSSPLPLSSLKQYRNNAASLKKQRDKVQRSQALLCMNTASMGNVTTTTSSSPSHSHILHHR